jgi:tape measure domain-containing protein
VADLTKTVSVIFQGEDNASTVSARLAESIDKVGREAAETAAAEEKWANSSIRAQLEQEKLAKSAEESARQTKNLGDQTEIGATKTEGFATALKALATAAVVKEFINANSELEKLTLGFTSVAGTTQAAAVEMDYVRDAADRLGIRLVDAGSAYLKLSAATKGTALEGEGAREIFEAVAKQLTLLGGSSADVSGALVQVAQGVSKGKFELEDLKSIAERIPGFFDKFATSLDKTTPELFKLIEQGRIGGPEFLKFAQTINSAIAGIEVDTFSSKAARAQDSWDKFLVSIGKAGLFDVAKEGLDLAAVGAEKAGAAVSVFASIFSGLLSASKGDGLSGIWERLTNSIKTAASAGIEYEAKLFGLDIATEKVNQTTAETARLIRQAKDEGVDWANSLDQSAAETQRLFGTDPIKKYSDALKTLGVDVNKVNADLIGAFETLSGSASATGKEILAGLGSALRSVANLEDINALGGALTTAFVNGRLTAEDFSQAAVNLGQAQQKILDPTNKAAEALKKQSDETKKAEEAARDFQLEMEKLASNERIANIEAKVSLNIAELEANTQRVIASFESINTTIGSTENLISDILGLLADYDSLNYSAIRILEQQLDLENQRRQEALDLQRSLTEAQIEQIRAQTQALERGDSIIKVDGAGLQPHLEAFMWEILRTIQVRVNQDGLKLLLGV